MADQSTEAAQTHTAFPHITRLALDMVGYNGGLHVLRAPEIGAEADVKRRLDEFLAGDGVYYDDLASLDAWLGSLTEDQFFNVAEGEETEMQAVLASAPSSADGLINSIYEHCI